MNDIGTIVLTGGLGFIFGTLFGVFITFRAYKSYVGEKQDGTI